MTHFHERLASVLLPVAVLTSAWGARAAVPAEYTGKPYMGTPQSIPGRVELANLDEGGLNVAFFADHRRENAVAEGYAPISGDDYRAGNLALPNICKTNRAKEVPGEGSEDFWEDGTRYPSEAMPFVYYMGYAHTVDWVRVTVNVKQAGKYNVSSSWACANNPCGLSIWFNDGSGKSDNPDHPLDGVNKSGKVQFDATNDYHKWRKYPNFAQVDLSAGDQVMTFHVEVNNHLQYGYLQFDSVDGVAQGGSGGAGGSGGTGTGGGASTAGGGAMGGAPSSVAGSSSIPVGTAGTTAGTAAGGSPASTGGAPGSTAAGSGMLGNPSSNTDSGCALAPASGTSHGRALIGLFVAGSLLLRRRRAFSG